MKRELVIDGDEQIADYCTDMAAMPHCLQKVVVEAEVGDLLVEHKIQTDKTAAPGCETFFTYGMVRALH